MSFKNDFKHWVRDLWRYPSFRPADASYDEYWSHRDMGSLNSFQKSRADFLLGRLHNGDSVLDIGCGDGRILAHLKAKRSSLHLTGIDGSPKALEIARERGLDVRQADIQDMASLGDLSADYITLFEVLEHMTDSESVLAWSCQHARKAVIFSVPNTGFIMHRLRLLLGRSPLQWRAHPAEHLRFWTMTDMQWWMKSLGYTSAVHGYEGVPLLNRIWPSLFAAGLIVVVPQKHD
jgi:methionine biosynthesis protein MetW